MTLNHKSTVVVPLNAVSTNATTSSRTRVAEYVRTLPPPWADTNVKDATPYLGFYVGPCADATTWTGPIHKWRDRTRRLAASEAPPTATLKEYASRALPCLGYTSQLLGPPTGMPRQEQSLIAQMVKIPYCACPRQALHSGRILRQPQVPPAREYCLAHLFRASVHHFEVSLASHNALVYTRETCLSIVYAADPHIPEPGWDGTTYATRLAWARLRVPTTTREIMNAPNKGRELQRLILTSVVQERYPEPYPKRSCPAHTSSPSENGMRDRPLVGRDATDDAPILRRSQTAKPIHDLVGSEDLDFFMANFPPPSKRSCRLPIQLFAGCDRLPAARHDLSSRDGSDCSRAENPRTLFSPQHRRPRAPRRRQPESPPRLLVQSHVLVHQGPLLPGGELERRAICCPRRCKSCDAPPGHLCGSPRSAQLAQCVCSSDA